jgi:hypothetical protein
VIRAKTKYEARLIASQYHCEEEEDDTDWFSNATCTEVLLDGTPEVILGDFREG